jgi:N6-adenosine-specific RNA methylase IME4
MFDDLPHRHFRMIAADVPWRYKVRSAKGLGRSAEKHYETMHLHRIARLPVEAYAAKDAHLLFWVTGPFLAIGAHVPIMRSWGFEPTAIWGVWIKPTKAHFDQGHMFFDGNMDRVWKMGMGHTSRQNAEFVVIGRKGNPKRLSKAVRQIITAPLREHSRKPDEFFINAEAYGEGPRLELFGREQREGWTVRGNQSDLF